MAFNGDNMSPLGGNSRSGQNLQGRNAPMGWSYQSGTDDIAAILATGYFDTFNKLLAAGHYIYASLSDGKFIVTVSSVDKALLQVVIDPDVFKGGPSAANPFIVEVFSIDDFPDPVDNVINGAALTVYIIRGAIDIGSNQFRFGFGTQLQGIATVAASITGNTSLPLFITDGVNASFGKELVFVQIGSGDLMALDSTDPTGSHAFVNCAFIARTIRLVRGPSILFDACSFQFGGRIAQNGPTGGFDNLIMSGNTLVLDNAGPVSEGLITFEDGSITDMVTFTSFVLVTLFAGTVGIKVEKGATILGWAMSNADLIAIAAGSVVIQVENPDDVNRGSISTGSFRELGGIILAVAPEDPEVTLVPITAPFGITQDGDGNIIISDTTTNQFHRMVDITNVIGFSIVTPGTTPRGITWHEGDLYSLDATSKLIYKHTGFTTATSTIAQPNPGTEDTNDMVFAGQNLITIDSTTHFVSVHDGFSTTILDTFAAPTTANPLTIAFDGLNLIIGDNVGNVFVMRGISGLVRYSFNTGKTSVTGASVIFDLDENSPGYIFIDSANEDFVFYNHPITFDNSSKTWEFSKIVGGPTSQDRGGSEYEGVAAEVTLPTPDLGIWVDIAATEIAYSLFSENEKILLMDELTGELQFTGVTIDACNLIGQVTITRGGSTGDRFYQIAVELNDVIVKDSIVQGVLPNASTFATITTIPISRKLIPAAKIKIKIRQVSGSIENPDVLFSKLAIT